MLSLGFSANSPLGDSWVFWGCRTRLHRVFGFSVALESSSLLAYYHAFRALGFWDLRVWSLVVL